MYLKSRELLTEEQRQEFKSIPSDLNERQMASYYTFSQHDMEIINRHRRSHNKLGFAVQLSILRYPGWSLSEIDSIPYSVLNYIAAQIDIDPDVFPLYAQREPTKREHLEEIRQEYGYKSFSIKEYKDLSHSLYSYALENGNSIYLIRIAMEKLRHNHIILPAITTIERIVWETRERAEKKIYKVINNSLSTEQLRGLDEMLNSKMEKGITRLAWLKEVPSNHSPETFLKVIERLEYVRKLNLNINTTGIHYNRLRQLSRLGARYEPYAFRKFEDLKRYAILVIFLLDLSQDLIDQAIEIHDKQINNLLSNGRKSQDEMQKHNGKVLNEKIIHYASLVKALIKAKTEGIDPFQVIESFVMPWNKLIESGEEADQLARPVDYDYLDLLTGRFNYLRKYTPTLLKCLQFKSNKATESLVTALNVLREMNENKKRTVPESAPLKFIPKRWEKHVIQADGSINRQYYELAVLTELRNCIRSGDVSVKGSRQFKDFDDYLFSKAEWEFARNKGTRLAVSLSYNDYIEERIKSLSDRLQWVSKHIDGLDGVLLEDGVIHVKRLEKDTPEDAKSFSSTLYSLLPRIKLTDLLLEVSSWTGFDEQFVHASTGRKPKEEEKSIIMAALMAMGTNVGLTKMADATPGISYYQMANTVEWRMYEDAMNKSLATLVNFHHSLNLPNYWGDGTTSSSDGMRVYIGVSALNSEHNPHYGSAKGATIYRFVSDQFSSFYTKVVNTNTRDAIHVIDGLLHHETDLNIEEHYTDTAGYTDQIFGLCHLLGFRFAPRLRDLSELKLYSFSKLGEYPKIEKILKGRINTKLIQENYDDVLRLTHSIREGKVSGSLIMGKLGSYARQNSLATALREMGRIEKTIYILDYISSETLRRRIQKGLNKGEAMNALARAIFFGKRGELNEKALKDQLQRASALSIIINAISIWNTVYLEKAIEYMKERNALKEDMLNYISPLNWDHINFLGEYSFNMKNVTTLNSLRPLNEPVNLNIP